jgi:hypothetical protein
MEKFMKRMITLIVLLLMLSCATSGGSQRTPQQTTREQASAIDGSVRLDAAIGDFSAYIAGRSLPNVTLTAVAVMNTPVQRLGNYVADKLSDSLLNNTGLRMVSRQDFERILAEQNIQLGGAVSDDTAVRIGHNLGWRTIIYGAVEPLSDAYHLSLRAVDVESGELRGSKSYILSGSDPVLVNLVNPNVSVQRLTERESLLAPFKGMQNDFDLQVSTNKTVYYDQENMQITLTANVDCYFVVYHLDIDNNMQVIYPNQWEQGRNTLKAGMPRVIPENSNFDLHPPFGEERILVYASNQPINIPEDQYRARQITREYLTSPQTQWQGGDGTRALTVRPKGATAQVSYSILPK